ncbi:MAG TPA: DUF3866 family protein [Actinomycetota bacterium]|nr:DUF3866 family protein [Actinomycetota bacterium]
MTSFREGIVRDVIATHDGLMRIVVAIESDEVNASVFTDLTGDVAPGDRVVVNALGLDLDLGTGGEGFVLWNLSRPGRANISPGHIVKLRYTPLQTNVLAAESPESDHHEALRDVLSIEGMPVVACGLHSQIAAAAAGIKAGAPGARIAYVMSDGASLPLAWSDLVRAVKKAGLVDVTCTYGHAFGGDLEAVNVFSALAAVRKAAAADAAIVAMGPGVVGTGTALGFTAMEQGMVLDATQALEGVPIACLRISFHDERTRHRGISHHSVTALTVGARARAIVAVPDLGDHSSDIHRSLQRIAERHALVEADGRPGIALMEERGIRPLSMGRPYEQIPELFLAAAAAGAVAASHL